MCVPANHVAYTGGTAYIIIVAVEHFEHTPEREREREREREVILVDCSALTLEKTFCRFTGTKRAAH